MGAVLGVELKKHLVPGALLQAQAEWLLYAPKSMFPYVQVRMLLWSWDVWSALVKVVLAAWQLVNRMPV